MYSLIVEKRETELFDHNLASNFAEVCQMFEYHREMGFHSVVKKMLRGKSFQWIITTIVKCPLNMLSISITNQWDCPINDVIMRSNFIAMNSRRYFLRKAKRG